MRFRERTRRKTRFLTALVATTVAFSLAVPSAALGAVVIGPDVNPSNAVVRSASGAGSHDIFIAGDRLYQATMNGVEVFQQNASEGDATWRGRYVLGYSADAVAAIGDYAYVQSGGQIQVLDVSEVGTPVAGATVDLPGGWSSGYDITVHGDKLLVPHQIYGVSVVDCSEPGTPTVQGRLDPDNKYVYSAAATGTHVFSVGAPLAGGVSVLNVGDMSDPTTVSLVATLAVGDVQSYVSDIEIRGDYAYLMFWTYGYDQGIAVVDVSDPENPSFVRWVDDGHNLNRATIQGDYLYVSTTDPSGNENRRLLTYSLADPSAPALLTNGLAEGIRADEPVACSWGLFLENVAGWSGYDLAAPGVPPTLVEGHAELASAMRVRLDGDTLWVADSSQGLIAKDVTQDFATTWKHVDRGGAWALDLAGGILFTGYGGTTPKLEVRDVNDIETEYSFDVTGTPYDIWAANGTLAFAATGDGLLAFNGGGVIASAHTTGGICKAVAAQGGYVYVASGSGEDACVSVFHWDGSGLTPVRDMQFPNEWGGMSEISGLDVSGGRLYVSGQQLALKVFDLTDPADPAPLGEVTDYSGASIKVQGTKAYVTTGYYARVFDVSDPSQPEELCSVDSLGDGEYYEIAPAGNTFYPAGPVGVAEVEWVDSEAPQVYLYGVGDGETYDHPVTPEFEFQGSDIATTMVTLDGDPWEPVELSEPGTYTVRGWARDFYGNEASASATFSIVEPTIEYCRLAGANRGATSARVSAEFWDRGSEYVVIATGRGFADALAGAPLAYVLEAPMLLVEPKSVPASVTAEIQRLGASRAVILGGTGAVGDEVLPALRSALGTTSPDAIERIGGTTRYDTARLIAKELYESPLRVSSMGKGPLGAAARPRAAGAEPKFGDVYVCTGQNYPDALAIAGVAASQMQPILLVTQNGVPSETASALASYCETDGVIVVGGSGVVSDEVSAAVGASRRLAGANRFDTARVISDYAIDEIDLSPYRVFLATAYNYPDALAAGAACGWTWSPLLLVNSPLSSAGCTPVRQFLTARKPQIHEIYTVGGTGAVPESVVDEVKALLE